MLSPVHHSFTQSLQEHGLSGTGEFYTKTADHKDNYSSYGNNTLSSKVQEVIRQQHSLYWAKLILPTPPRSSLHTLTTTHHRPISVEVGQPVQTPSFCVTSTRLTSVEVDSFCVPSTRPISVEVGQPEQTPSSCVPSTRPLSELTYKWDSQYKLPHLYQFLQLRELVHKTIGVWHQIVRSDVDHFNSLAGCLVQHSLKYAQSRTICKTTKIIEKQREG